MGDYMREIRYWQGLAELVEEERRKKCDTCAHKGKQDCHGCRVMTGNAVHPVLWESAVN